MRVFVQLLAMLTGLALALLTIGAARSIPGTVQAISLVALGLTLVIFFFSSSHTLPFSVGLGLGLDAFSAYPFFVWTLCVLCVAVFGQWMSRCHLTNRSLFALLALGLLLRIAITILVPAVDMLAVFILRHGIMPTVSVSILVDTLKAIGIELVILFTIFIFYSRVGGRVASTITRVHPL